MKCFLAAFCALSAFFCHAQYAPQATIAGSTAIYKSSNQFIAWANGCHVRRGLQQIDNASFGYATAGDSSAALGMPDGNIISLGDSGVAVLTFAKPIANGPGPDFAVFENGFANVANPEEAFLELAFVEVSSDGVHFTRFPATSLTQDTTQLSSVASPTYINARQLNNLAGKYIGSWGTPFDLDELAGTPGLDVTAITHVRIVDVIGSIGNAGSPDANGRKINDPFPTPFPAGGFDLDAVGVIRAVPAEVLPGAGFEGLRLYPNPANDEIMLGLPEHSGNASIVLRDMTGRILQQQATQSGSTILSLKALAPGGYYITIRLENGATCTRSFLHR